MAHAPQDVPDESRDGDDIGARIRTLRRAKGTSLRALAGELGISPSALSQIERGTMRPSVTRLIQIVSLLNAPLSAVFEPGRATHALDDDVVVTRGGDMPMLELGQGVRYRRLLPESVPGLEIYECTYPPGAESTQDGEFLRHGGHEMGSVLSGRLLIEVGDDTHELGPGDAIKFPSSRPHRIANTGAVPAVAVWVNLG
ncbi:cupin domain-containing protein [Haloechinothrix salitolerans]|uniref:Cupin domain-containing protein n=1 Tax=Haloechinothrix salitolerans TaxID=926830 RepID=A0ABW2C5S1_9PSEU